MAGAYFAPLVGLPDIITKPGTYKTRCGETVTIESVPVPAYAHGFNRIGYYDQCGTRESWHKSGRLYAGFECRNDIVSSF